MAEVRIVGTGRLKDYAGAIDVLKQVSIVAEAVDGAEVWEVFADEDTGFFVLNETFASEEACSGIEGCNNLQKVFRRRSPRPWCSNSR